MAQQGDTVTFQIRDVYLPGARELLQSLEECERLIGVLSDITGAAAGAEKFGVVELANRTKVIVPVNRLSSVAMSPAEANEAMEEEGEKNGD